MLLCSINRATPIEAEIVRGKGREPLQRRIEKPHRAAQRAALRVVIRGRELNETLIELDVVAVGFEPQRLPRFMRVPELGGVEVINALGERVQSPARVPRLKVSHIAAVKSAVVPTPPMSRVRCSSPESSTFTMASPMRFAATGSPM